MWCRAGSKQAETQAKTARVVVQKKTNNLKAKLKQAQQDIEVTEKAILVIKSNREQLSSAILAATNQLQEARRKEDALRRELLELNARKQKVNSYIK